MEWDLSIRCSLIALIALAFAGWTDIIAHYLLTHPDYATYISRPVLALLAHIEERLVFPGWILVAVLGLLCKRLGYGSLALAYVLAFFYVFHVLIVGYCIGLSTTVYSGSVLMAGLIIGTLFLEAKPVIYALPTLIAGMIAVTIAEQRGLLPYAPLLLQAPFRDGHLSTSWLATFGGFDFTLLTSMFAMGLFIMHRWQAQERQIAEANRVLRRFLSPQVARMASELGMSSVFQKSRSQLTAIECDLRGFTAFSESVAPEEVIELLERYYAVIGEAVAEHGGTIKDYSGDGVLILVGARRPTPITPGAPLLSPSSYSGE